MKKRSKVRAVKNSKRSSNDKALNSLTKKFMLSAVQVIAEKIVLLKKRNDGKVPYGEFSKLWNAGKETYPKMSRKTINNYVKKIESAAEKKYLA
jgi:ribosomal protein L22